MVVIVNPSTQPDEIDNQGTLSELNEDILSELDQESNVIQIKRKSGKPKKAGTEKSMKDKIVEKVLDIIIGKESTINPLVELTHDDIVKHALATKISHELKNVKGKVLYQLGQLDNINEREFDLEVRPDYLGEAGHSIYLGGRNFVKSDFKELYFLFDKLVAGALETMVDQFRDKKDSLQLEGQVNMFPELNQTFLNSIEVNTQIYSWFKGENIETTLTVCSAEKGLYVLKFDKKIYLHKSDLYILYTKFDEIIDRILGTNA